jgi:hypothetical protein
MFDNIHAGMNAIYSLSTIAISLGQPLIIKATGRKVPSYMRHRASMVIEDGIVTKDRYGTIGRIYEQGRTERIFNEFLRRGFRVYTTENPGSAGIKSE